jgi:hypothetical protein
MLQAYTYFPNCKFSEINVMHLIFSLLRINGLLVFRALLAHPHEARGILLACYVPNPGAAN